MIDMRNIMRKECLENLLNFFGEVKEYKYDNYYLNKIIYGYLYYIYYVYLYLCICLHLCT